jgi:hypothetical protein
MAGELNYTVRRAQESTPHIVDIRSMQRVNNEMLAILAQFHAFFDYTLFICES